MRVLIGCEFSGRVRDAFLKRGHDAISCDLLPTEVPGPHFQGDVFDLLERETFDLIIAFPPCTHLSSSGAVYWKQKQADGRQQAAIAFVRKLHDAPVARIAIENPSGILSSVWRKPDQYFHPYYFGDPYRKRTGLWLKNLPSLKNTKLVSPVANWHSGSTRGGKKRDGTRTTSKFPSLKSGWRNRSLTFPGIAEAMAEQWG